MVPALLQTPEYARAVLTLPGGATDYGASADDIDRMIAERMRRSSILFEPGRDVTVLVGEAALCTQVGSPDVMTHQRNHISRLQQTVTHAKIGVIRFDRCPIVPLHGWGQRDHIITIETRGGDLEIADPVEVSQYEQWGALLVDAAIFTADHGMAERSGRDADPRRQGVPRLTVRRLAAKWGRVPRSR